MQSFKITIAKLKIMYIEDKSLRVLKIFFLLCSNSWCTYQWIFSDFDWMPHFQIRSTISFMHLGEFFSSLFLFFSHFR